MSPTRRPSPAARLRDRVRHLRDRRPAVDHAVRAYDRHSAVLGSQVAAALTYFGFLSFFPLLALAFSVVGYVSVFYPGAQDSVMRVVEDAFPSLIGTGEGQIDVNDIIAAKRGAGVIGVLGLLYTGFGWIDALRDGLRRVFGTLEARMPFLRKKLVDLVVLVLLGVALLASIVVSSLATAATTQALGWVDLADSAAAAVLLKVLSVTLVLAGDTVLFAILLSRLSGAHLPWRRVRSGAVLAAVCFEVLKLLGTFLVGRTTTNPVYGTFAVVVGLLVWINLVSRLLVFVAAWTATQPYSLLPGEAPLAVTGHSTTLAASTEPVSVVAPAGQGTVPAGQAAAVRRPRRRWRWRGAAVGAAAGAGLAAVLTRSRQSGGKE